MWNRLLALALLLVPLAWIAAADTSPGRIRVLLVGGQNNHDWQKSNAFLMAFLANQPGIAVEESNTPPNKAPKEAWDAWKPDFTKYGAVLLNYNGEMWPDDVKAAMEKYLEDGGGVMPLHAANNSFSGWNGFEQAVGLLWRGKEFGASVFFDEVGKLQREEKNQGRGMGHGSQYDWKMTVRDATHPITAGMPVNWIHRLDELYHGQRGPADKLNILLSAFSDPTKGGTGKDEPIVWWVPVGKGKMLTNVMGHVGDTACLSCVGYQTVLLRSIEWLAKGGCTTAIPADFPTDKASQKFVHHRDPRGLPHRQGEPELSRRRGQGAAVGEGPLGRGVDEALQAAARLPHRAGGAGTGDHQSGVFRLGRQRQPLRLRDAHLHDGCGCEG
jgi:hypothetical protein